MAQKSQQAIEAARETDGIVTFENDGSYIHVEWKDSVPLEADKLIRDNRWMITPSSARTAKFKIYK